MGCVAVEVRAEKVATRLGRGQTNFLANYDRSGTAWIYQLIAIDASAFSEGPSTRSTKGIWRSDASLLGRVDSTA